MRSPIFLALLGLCGVGFFGLTTPSPQEAQKICLYSRLPLMAPPKLEGLATRLNQSKPFVVVALGSSSTAGVGAAYSYTKVLEEALSETIPQVNFRVFNRGVAGDTVERVLLRIERDVLNLHPDLVIWQLGTNEVIQGVELRTFRVQVEQGIQRIRKRGAELFLMDGQAYPGLGNSPAYAAFQRALSEIAHQNDLVLVPRFQLMKDLLASGYTYTDLLAEDQFHPSTFMQNCIGHYLAQMISQLAKKP